ncbi:hypothetical protein [Ereboglobus luteus]|uniref:CobW/HypB/UreG nucleotide-binding domain-containing protein n=1 Tax=Ereboglobus luteus TaxID=1796921 RepID=A0A2U8E5U9_9BACT|nr:hypothetical protein [Ereboglobus luteus]AWI09934.1 hypothetical protein CKA38_12355 [Ereboglobus luteus]
MNDISKPFVYLVIGATGSGRRGMLADILAEGLDAGDRPLVMLAENEAADAADASLGEIARWQWRAQGGGPEGLDGRIEAEGVDIAGRTHVFFVTDGRRNPIDQIEALKPWLTEAGGELARVVCVVNCQLAEQNRSLMTWYDACIHFSDIVLLARRDGVTNKWVSDFQARYKNKFYPCLFEFVKDGRVRNPSLVLEPEARRMSHYFEEADYELAGGGDIEEGIDDDDKPRKRQSDEEIEVTEQLDEYLARRAGGRRVKEIPDIAKFLDAD